MPTKILWKKNPDENFLGVNIKKKINWNFLQLNEVKLSYYGVAIHLLSGFWSVFRTETSLTHWILIGSLPNQKKWIKQLKDYMYTKFHNDPTKTLGVIGILVQSSCATRPAGQDANETLITPRISNLYLWNFLSI